MRETATSSKANQSAEGTALFRRAMWLSIAFFAIALVLPVERAEERSEGNIFGGTLYGWNLFLASFRLLG